MAMRRARKLPPAGLVRRSATSASRWVNPRFSGAPMSSTTMPGARSRSSRNAGASTWAVIIGVAVMRTTPSGLPSASMAKTEASADSADSACSAMRLARSVGMSRVPSRRNSGVPITSSSRSNRRDTVAWSTPSAFEAAPCVP